MVFKCGQTQDRAAAALGLPPRKLQPYPALSVLVNHSKLLHCRLNSGLNSPTATKYLQTYTGTYVTPGWRAGTANIISENYKYVIDDLKLLITV